MASADLLVLLSDIDGLYDAPPGASRKAKLIPLVERITPEIEAMAGAAGSELSRGGMQTKIEAGKIATTAGTHMVIASGRVDASAARDRGRRALHLVPHAGQSGHRAQEVDRRLARAARHADDRRRRGGGAAQRQEPAAGRRHPRRRRVRARRRGGRSAGRTAPRSARGLVAYDAEDADKIKGRSSADILLILGFGGRAEMVHRDDLVVGQAELQRADERRGAPSRDGCTASRRTKTPASGETAEAGVVSYRPDSR